MDAQVKKFRKANCCCNCKDHPLGFWEYVVHCQCDVMAILSDPCQHVGGCLPPVTWYSTISTPESSGVVSYRSQCAESKTIRPTQSVDLDLFYAVPPSTSY